jgi:hypothetical protein
VGRSGTTQDPEGEADRPRLLGRDPLEHDATTRGPLGRRNRSTLGAIPEALGVTVVIDEIANQIGG